MGKGRRGVTIFELIITLVIIGLVASSGSMRISSQVHRLRAQAEGDRLLACLRWVREMAHSRAPLWQQGYGVYFWYNLTTQSCIQYSPYTPNQYRVPDDSRFNQIATQLDLGAPHRPVTLGQRQPIDFANLTPEELSSGLRIVFQSDQPGLPPYTPLSLRNFPNPVAGRNWRRDRVVFWPPGVQAPLLAGNPWPSEYGTTLPRPRRNQTYNRIYILSPTDDPDNVNPQLRRMPVRIHIHPGTGVVRMMTAFERRDDGTW